MEVVGALGYFSPSFVEAGHTRSEAFLGRTYLDTLVEQLEVVLLLGNHLVEVLSGLFELN